MYRKDLHTQEILSHDNDIQDVENCVLRLWDKYSFASKFYSDEEALVVSITYKNGENFFLMEDCRCNGFTMRGLVEIEKLENLIFRLRDYNEEQISNI